jgi:hypothetical protein
MRSVKKLDNAETFVDRFEQRAIPPLAFAQGVDFGGQVSFRIADAVFDRLHDHNLDTLDMRCGLAARDMPHAAVSFAGSGEAHERS